MFFKPMESVVRPIVKRAVPSPIRIWMRDVLNARRVRRNPVRIVLETEILPAYARLGGRILWVGCRRYTKKYGSLLSLYGGECWTTDIEMGHAKWGEPGRHFTWDLTEIDRLIARGTFDSVLCNGVFGFGLNNREAQLAALEAMGNILKPGGRLLLGWNVERVEDLTGLASVQKAFAADDPTSQGARREISDAGYLYCFLRRRGE